MQVILGAWKARRVRLLVSRHSLSQLAQKDDAAYNIATECEILPHYPIGTWDQQVATWDELAGTWNDAKRNQQIQKELEQLAKSGNDVRDRGAYVDALYAGVDAFVTSDKQLAGSGPAKRIEERFALRVVTPQGLASELGSYPTPR